MAQSLFLVEFFSHGHALSYIRNLLRTKELLWRDLRNRDTPLLHCWPPTATLESQLGYSARYRSLSWQIQPSEWIEQRLQSAWSGGKTSPEGQNGRCPARVYAGAGRRSPERQCSANGGRALSFPAAHR